MADRLDEERFSFKNPDRLDRLVIIGVAVIVLAGSVLMVSHSGQGGPASGIVGGPRQAVVIISPEFDHKLKVAKTLLNSDDLAKGRELIDQMIEDYPYDGRPYMLLGDMYVRRQQPVSAMLEYRRGVDLNPDFLDKKAELFRGKQIKNILEEARRAIFGGLERKPEDPQLKEQREIFYYMLRRVAGSCG
jgi:tetratricopeptide (TPR) repeat protein